MSRSGIYYAVDSEGRIMAWGSTRADVALIVKERGLTGCRVIPAGLYKAK